MGCVEAGMVLLEKDDQCGRLGLGACQLDSREAVRGSADAPVCDR